MRYLITHPDHKPFLTAWFDPENNWMEGMTVYDLTASKYMVIRFKWDDIPIDSL